MTGQLLEPQVNIPPTIQQGDTVNWRDYPFTDDSGASYDSSAYSLSFVLAGPTAAQTFTGVANGTGWLTTVSSAASALLQPGTYWWQARLTATADGSIRTIADGATVALMNLANAGAGYDGSSEAVQSLNKWKAALAALAPSDGKAPVASYRIGGREMTYRNIDDVMKAISYWQAVVFKETTQASLAQGQGNPRKTYVRFP